jgi:hypothetical protein
MKARQLIYCASYGPEELKVIEQAFDDAWAAIEGNFGGRPQNPRKRTHQIGKGRAVGSGGGCPSPRGSQGGCNGACLSHA